jgi:hypothetical protein
VIFYFPAIASDRIAARSTSARRYNRRSSRCIGMIPTAIIDLESYAYHAGLTAFRWTNSGRKLSYDHHQRNKSAVAIQNYDHLSVD